MMRGKWSEQGVPHKGWICVGVFDLGTDIEREICEMCETQEIRFVHSMEHPNYPVALAVGCVCAGHMEEDSEGARRRESAVRNTASRKSRWLSRKWKVSAKGNPYLRTRDGFHVVVFPANPTRTQWGGKVEDTTNGRKIFARQTFPSQDAAKLAAFDTIVVLKAQRS